MGKGMVGVRRKEVKKGAVELPFMYKEERQAAGRKERGKEKQHLAQSWE